MSSDWQARFQFLTENTIDIICRAQMDGVLSYVSPSCFHVLGWAPTEMLGRRWDAFLLNANSPSLADRSPLTTRMRMKNGGVAWVEIRSNVITEPGEIMIVIRDITERKTLADKLAAFEANDFRTGLATSRALEEAIEREWNRMVRESSQLSLLLLDFNGFRHFHSGTAHFEGDRCLAKIAAVIQPILRVTDAAAHHRGEQIAILLSSTGAYGAATVADKVRTAVRNLGDGNDPAVHIGIASTRGRGAVSRRMPELLLLAAESALHKAIERTPDLLKVHPR